jgi:RNase P subunit RPR2
MSSTAKYQLSLPFALLPASSSLAALHATRARIFHPTESAFLDSTHCVKCGSYLSHGQMARPARKSSRREDSRRVMRRTCVVCGFSHELPVDRGNAASFPRTRKAKASTQPVQKLSKVVEYPSLPSPSPSIGSSNPRSAPNPSPSDHSASARSKLRGRKKSGLQDMLSRNREKEAKQPEARSEGLGGLEAFLSGL